MRIVSALGGLAGAVALTALNPGARKPGKRTSRPDLLGINAAARILKGPGFKKKAPGKSDSLLSDLVTNSLYFGMADAGTNTQTLARGALLGLGAGVGAVTLAKPMGLSNNTGMNQSIKDQVLTVAWYVIGGLVAAAAINLLSRNSAT